MARLAAQFALILVTAASLATSLKAQVMNMPPGGPGGQAFRGTVTAADASGITARTEDGAVYKVVITPNTRLMQGQEPVKAADVKPGQAVVAMGRTDDEKKEVHAAMVMVLSAEQAAQMEARAKEMQASLGKTWIMGKVTAIDETKLTIERQDKVSQVIEVDENTSFRRGGGRMMMGNGNGMRMGMRRDGNTPAGQQQAPPPEGEAITLADIKVGDNVTGQGALQNGTFVAKTLNLLPQRRGPRPGGGMGSQQPPQQ